MRGPTSFPMLLGEFVNEKLVKINTSNGVVSFSNNSMINLCHCQHEADLENYLSAEFHILLIDESTTFTEKMIRFLRGRLRLGSLVVPKKFRKALPFIIMSTNPRGVSHVYFKREFVDAGTPLKPFKAAVDEGGMMRCFVPSLLTQNPYIEEGYADRLRGMGDAEIVDAYLAGDWTVVEGAALKKLNRKIHIIDHNLLSKHWKISRGYDYGSSAPYSVIFYAVANGESETKFCPPKDSIIACGFIYGADDKDHGLQEEPNITAKKIKAYQKENFPGVTVYPGPADNAIFDKDRGPSIASQMEDEGVLWLTSNKSPGSRVNGLAIARTYINNTVNKSQDPHFYMTDNTEPLYGQLAALTLDPKNPEDVDTDCNDHSWDDLRYIFLHKSQTITTKQVNGA